MKARSGKSGSGPEDGLVPSRETDGKQQPQWTSRAHGAGANGLKKETEEPGKCQDDKSKTFGREQGATKRRKGTAIRTRVDSDGCDRVRPDRLRPGQPKQPKSLLVCVCWCVCGLVCVCVGVCVLVCVCKTTYHASQGLALCRRCVRMGLGFDGPSSTFGEMAYRVHQSGRWRQPKPDKVHPPQSPPLLRQPSNPPKAAAANASAEVQRLETAISATLVEALRAEDSVLQTLHRTRQAACGPSRGSDHESRRAEGDLRGRSCRGQEEMPEDASPAPPVPACSLQVAERQRQIDDLMKEREMWKVAKKQGVWCSDGPPHL